jgi:hypothetical protein
VKKIEFIGKFKDLIPMGYSFHKLYARNYRVYTKNQIWIWVAGKTISIKDLGTEHSFKIAKLIIDNKYPVYNEDKDYKIIFFKKGEPKCVMLDEKTGEVEIRREFTKSDKFNYDKIPQYDYDRYRELILNMDILESIKELHKNNMITL